MDLITFFLLLAATLIIAANLFALYWFGSMLIPVIAGGGPYVPTRPEIQEQMIALAQLTSEDIIVDLGSGDGRLVIGALQAGAKHGIGYEIHPGLVRLSKWKLRRAGFSNNSHVHNKSMWNADLSGVTVVFLYQIPYAMGRMKRLLESQLPSGSRIISHAFKLPDWEPDAMDGNVLLYTIKDQA